MSNEAPRNGHSSSSTASEGRRRDHHRPQHMGLAGAEAAEEVGASVGEGTAQRQQQSDHGPSLTIQWNDRTVQRTDRPMSTERPHGALRWSTREDVIGWPRRPRPLQALARNVRAARTRAGLSLDELGRRAQVSKGALVALEKAQGNPNFATLVRLADTLGVSVSALTEGPAEGRVRVVSADAVEPCGPGPGAVRPGSC